MHQNAEVDYEALYAIKHQQLLILARWLSLPVEERRARLERQRQREADEELAKTVNVEGVY